MISTLGKQIVQTERNYMAHVYLSIIVLASLMHLFYTFAFWAVGLWHMALYNIGSIVFYVCAGFGVKMGLSKMLICFAHFEVCLFVVLAVVNAGWDFGFQLLLFCVASLVYFCPFKNRYIPYLFSLGELILFLSLKLYTYYGPAAPPNEQLRQMEILIFIFNVCSSFFVILFSAFITRLSVNTMQKQLLDENEGLSILATHDSLTGLLLRRCMEESLQKLWEPGKPCSTRIAVAMCDIDDFKKVNDTYGHPCGDMVLKEISSILSSANTHACRWGGEEFLLLFSNHNKQEAFSLLQGLCKMIALHPFIYGDIRLHVTMTFGTADSSEAGNPAAMIALSDNRLYIGKKQGKNRVVK